jgi:hypothetical protein
MADGEKEVNKADISSEEIVETLTKEQNEEPVKQTYKEIAKRNGMSYTVTEVPPFFTSVLLGLQHYLTMLGATVLIPLLICPAMGADGLQTAEVISSIFFVSGLNTVSSILLLLSFLCKFRLQRYFHFSKAASNYCWRSVRFIWHNDIVFKANCFLRLEHFFVQVTYCAGGVLLIPTTHFPDHIQ